MRRPASGYTLAELLVVLVILGIVATGVAPAFRANQRHALDAAADEVSRVLAAARNTALKTGAPVRLTLNPATREFTIDRLDDSITASLESGTLSLAPEVTIAGEPMRVSFGRTGFVPPDSLLLQSADGTRLIRVGGWTSASQTDRENEVLP